MNHKKIQRALSISKYNGWSIALFSGLVVLISLFLGDFTSVGVGLLVVLAGSMEVCGHHLLKRGRRSAILWLSGSQLWLFLVIVTYAVAQIVFFDLARLLSATLGLIQAVVDRAKAFGLLSASDLDLIQTVVRDEEAIRELLTTAFYATYVGVILTVFLYQGGLFLFYQSRRKYL